MKVFMFNHSGSFNRGCEAIVKGTVNIVNHCGGKNDYILSSCAPEEDTVLEQIVKVVPFSQKPLNKAQHAVAALNIKIRGDERYSVIKTYADFFRDAEKADLCLSIGGDTYCYGDNAVVRILTEELKKRGKKIILWGASIGEEDLTVEKEKNLACFDAIFARETLTYALMKSKGLNQNVFLFPDPAFTLSAEMLPFPAGWQEGNTLGINLSPLVTQKNPQLFGVVSDFIKYVLNNTGMSVALVPHVTSPAGNDMTILENLYEENISESNGRVLLLPADLSAAQYKGYIARLRFFVGARTHAILAGYTSCVPTIVLGYSVKSRGIARDIFGDERFVLDAVRTTQIQPLVDAFRSMTANEHELKCILSNTIPLKIIDAYSAGSELMKI